MVEDEPDILAIIELALKLDPGMLVEVTARSGAAAHAAVRGAEAPFDLLLLNVALPDVSGVDLARSLRTEATAREARVVFITARLTRHERERYAQVPRAMLIGKPFDPVALAGDIRAFHES